MRALTANRAGTIVMQHLKTAIVILATTLLLHGCASGFKATHDFDETKDFTTYKTFAWISEHPMKLGATDRIVSPLMEQRVMETVENALLAKGYTKVGNAESADFALGFTVGSREEVHVNSSPLNVVSSYRLWVRPPGCMGWCLLWRPNRDDGPTIYKGYVSHRRI